MTDDGELPHGTKIGRFRVVGRLGAGGMGVVYEAHDKELDRRVALKVLRDTAATEEDRMRMLREGQAMARITHPNVITVYEVGIEGAMVFLAQELLDGGTLGQWLAAPDARSPRDVIDRFVAAGRGLAAAHAAELVHRDFKPDNVLLGKDGRVRVADFGLARAIGAVGGSLAATTRPNRAAQSRAPGGELTRSPMSPLTATGAVMGTPMFMAPEQHLGEPTDARSDQFSFCVALYHALHGDWPFPGKTAVALADAVIAGRMQPPPRGHRVPARIRKILARGLATKPADRYASMDELLAELVHEPARPGRRLAIAAGLAAVAGGALAGGYALRSRSKEEEPPRQPVTYDLKALDNARAIDWLSSAIERGQLDDAYEKYDMSGALKLQAGDRAQASIAWASGVVALVLRGHLELAQTRLRDVDGAKGTDPVALAYADLAAASYARARGELSTAIERSRQCAMAFASTVPMLGAMCLQLRGEASAEMGDAAAARRAYDEGLAIARKEPGAPVAMGLELALAELELGEGKAEEAAAKATALQAQAAERGAALPEAHAWVVLARAQLALAETQKANDALDHVKADRVQACRPRIEAKIARGQTLAAIERDPDGLVQIDAARAEAERHGFVGLVLQARLARVEALHALGAPELAAEQSALVKDADARGFGRIARLAETVAQR